MVHTQEVSVSVIRTELAELRAELADFRKGLILRIWLLGALLYLSNVASAAAIIIAVKFLP